MAVDPGQVLRDAGVEVIHLVVVLDRGEGGPRVGGIGVSEAEMHIVGDDSIDGFMVMIVNGIKQGTNGGGGGALSHGHGRRLSRLGSMGGG